MHLDDTCRRDGVRHAAGADPQRRPRLTSKDRQRAAIDKRRLGDADHRHAAEALMEMKAQAGTTLLQTTMTVDDDDVRTDRGYRQSSHQTRQLALVEVARLVCADLVDHLGPGGQSFAVAPVVERQARGSSRGLAVLDIEGDQHPLG